MAMRYQCFLSNCQPMLAELGRDIGKEERKTSFRAKIANKFICARCKYQINCFSLEYISTFIYFRPYTCWMRYERWRLTAMALHGPGYTTTRSLRNNVINFPLKRNLFSFFCMFGDFRQQLNCFTSRMASVLRP